MNPRNRRANQFDRALVQCALCLGAVALDGCGAMEIDHLEGEPPSAEPFSQPIIRRTHPAIAGLQRFVAAMQRNQADLAYAQLSADTRKSLQARAGTAGIRGVDLLRLKKLPVGNTMQGAVAFDPVAMFVVNDIATLQLVATSNDGANVEQKVQMTTKDGKSRVVLMRYEPYSWRIHQPTIIFP